MVAQYLISGALGCLPGEAELLAILVHMGFAAVARWSMNSAG
jgi:hypothetical protein